MAKSLEQLRREAQKLQDRIDFLEQSEGKITDYVAQLRKAIADAGFEVEDVVKRLQERKTRARMGTAAAKSAVPQSQDDSGMKPERGATYKHSSWPEPWTSAGKRAPNYVIASLRSGKTWKQLLAK